MRTKTTIFRNHFPLASLSRSRSGIRCAMLGVIALGGLFFFSGSGIAREPIEWLSMNSAGRLTYGADELGNRIPDFSTAGYRGGGVELPNVPTFLRIDAPSGQDDTDVIQAALDKVADRPVGGDGFRGAVELGPGTFRLKGTLRLSASGVVLRGGGAKTTLRAEGATRTIIVVGGKGTWRRSGPASRITDRYVAVGAKNVQVENAGAFKVGDRIIVQRPSTEEWIAEIGMNRIPPRSEKRGGTEIRPWLPGPGLLFDRTVVGVKGDVIELDAALTNAMQPNDRPSVWPYEFADRIRNVGVENLRATGSEFLKDARDENDRNRNTHFIAFGGVEDAWLQSVVMEDFTGAIAFQTAAIRVTATDFQWKSSGELKRRGALPLAVSIDGQNILVQQCSMSGASYIAWATQSRAPGPNVVRNCSASGERVSAQMHQRWSTGLLFENVRVQGALHIGNRGNAGTGQGWAGANSMVWNSSATTWLVENPPTARNWAFGMQGRLVKRHEALGEIVSPGKNVEPWSLYRHQLSERLQGGAARSAK
jgi:hypothetical protein